MITWYVYFLTISNLTKVYFLQNYSLLRCKFISSDHCAWQIIFFCCRSGKKLSYFGDVLIKPSQERKKSIFIYGFGFLLGEFCMKKQNFPFFGLKNQFGVFKNGPEGVKPKKYKCANNFFPLHFRKKPKALS